MKKIILSFILFSMAIIASGQSGAIYLCNNCTYKTSNGQTITLNEDGSVKKNGKFAQNFKCENVDGEVTIYFKDKPVSILRFVDDGKCTLKDKKTNLCYSLVSCKPILMPEDVPLQDTSYTFTAYKSLKDILIILKDYFDPTKGSYYYIKNKKFQGYSKKERCYHADITQVSEEECTVVYSWECD